MRAGRPVHAALGRAVADEVLRGRDDAVAQVVALQPADERDAHARDEVRVLAERLLGAAPARIAADVEHRRRGPGGRRSRASASRIASASASASAGLPGARDADRLREDRRVSRHQARADLLVHDRRDAEPRLVDEVALDLVGERCRLLRRRRLLAPADARDVPEAVLGERAGPRARTPPPSASWNTQALPSCATFSSSVIRREQVLDPLVDRARRRRGRAACPVDRRSSRAVRDRAAGPADDEPRRQDDLAPAGCDGSSIKLDQQSHGLARPSAGSAARSSSAAGSPSADSGTLSKPITERSSGHARPERARDGDRLDRRRVVRGEDRRRPRLEHQQLARRIAAPSPAW